jgi:hypothetical protein
MKLSGLLPIASACIATLLATVPAHASQDNPPAASAANLGGLHDFDFLVGEWRAHHRKLKERLANNHEWVEFDGTQSMRKLMDGYANEDDNIFNVPGGAYRGVSLRAYDPKTGQWAIWWLDGRNPFGDLDPPVKGSFKDGIGTFYADDMLRGKPIRVRFLWSHITPTSARWEQAFSADGGKTWEVNWTTQFERAK